MNSAPSFLEFKRFILYGFMLIIGPASSFWGGIYDFEIDLKILNSNHTIKETLGPKQAPDMRSDSASALWPPLYLKA